MAGTPRTFREVRNRIDVPLSYAVDDQHRFVPLQAYGDAVFLYGRAELAYGLLDQALPFIHHSAHCDLATSRVRGVDCTCAAAHVTASIHALLKDRP
jgi:hypothetical protein